MRRHSSYNYAFNNPINFIDPAGMASRQLTMASEGGAVDFEPSWTNPNWTGNEYDTNESLGAEVAIGGGGFSMEDLGIVYEGEEAQNMFGNLMNPQYDFSQFDFSQYGIDNPDDIIIRNNKGHIMYRIISDVKKDVYLDTDTEIGNPMTINLEDYKKKGAHAVGFSLDYSGTFGGGMNGGLAFVYFMKGKDAGNGFVFGYRGNTGLEGSVGISKFYSTYIDSDMKNFNAAGYAGKSSGHAFGVGVWGYSKSWGNRTNEGELWQGQRSKTTWVTVSTGIGHGGSVGAKVFWSEYTLLKKLF